MKKLCKKKLTLHHDLWLKAKKRVNFIWAPEIIIDVLAHKGQTRLKMFSVFLWTNQKFMQQAVKV